MTIYDLNRLQPVAPVVMPGGHFARSIAVSNAAILALARNEGGTPVGMIDSIRLALSSGVAAALPTLGVYANSIPTSTGVLASSPSGANIFFASPDGNVALYTASANTFVASRHDFTSLSGAFAASDFGWYVAGNSVLDASLVPSGTISASPLPHLGIQCHGPGRIFDFRRISGGGRQPDAGGCCPNGLGQPVFGFDGGSSRTARCRKHQLNFLVDFFHIHIGRPHLRNLRFRKHQRPRCHQFFAHSCTIAGYLARLP